jgi:hypothetical protein
MCAMRPAVSPLFAPDPPAPSGCCGSASRRPRRLFICEVFYREFCAAVARTPRVVEIEFIEQGLHSKQSGQMRDALQGHVDACDPARYEYLLLGYGLCNNGLAGLHARQVPFVIPRAHDCITFFLGNRQRYDEVFKSKPGTYYLTSGWLERAHNSEQKLSGPSGTHAEQAAYEDYVKRFGEEEAKYLMETLGAWRANYQRMLYIELGLGDPHALRAAAEAHAKQLGLPLEETPGDMRLFQALVDGPPWDENEFLVVPPGHEIRPSYDEKVLEARPLSGSS